MDILPLHRFSDPAAMLALLDAHSLGAWVCRGAHGLLANHVGRHEARQPRPWQVANLEQQAIDRGPGSPA